jgi:hypothetical protein
LLRGNDFLETLPVALVELKGFVEPSLEVIDPPLLGDLILEAPRYDRSLASMRSRSFWFVSCTSLSSASNSGLANERAGTPIEAQSYANKVMTPEMAKVHREYTKAKAKFDTLAKRPKSDDAPPAWPTIVIE